MLSDINSLIILTECSTGTKSVFSQTSSMSENDGHNSASDGEGGGKRKRRQRQKQEPLSYAFRGSGYQKKKQTASLGSDYTVIQRPPAPKMQQPSSQHYSNQNSGPQYNNARPNHAQMNNVGGGQQNHGAGQNTNYMQSQNTNNYQVPFGMPVIKISLPKQPNLPQQPYKQASSPAVTFEKSLHYIPPR